MILQSFLLLNIIIHSVIAEIYSSNGCRGAILVKSNQDLVALRDCRIVEGSITIRILSSSEEIVDLSQLQQVHGDLVFEGNADLLQIVLPNLRQVRGRLVFQDNRRLERLVLTQLTSVQALDISVGPALASILFPAGLSHIDSLSIKDTVITRIEGLATIRMRDVHITNNRYLRHINLNRLEQVSGVITIAANSPLLTLDLSSLSDMFQADFRDVAQLVGLNKVHRIAGDLSFVSNSFSLLGLPNITQIGGTLTVSNNALLKKLSIPQLQLLGGTLSLANNTFLSNVNVPKLQQVDGTVDITGNFDRVDLPSLADIRGGLNVQTSSIQFSCDDSVNRLQGGVTKGHDFICKANELNPSTINHSVASIATDNHTSSSSNKFSLPTAIILTLQFILIYYLSL